MEHFVSVNIEQGNKSVGMVKLPLLSALKETIVNAPEDKHDCWLISNGYSSLTDRYTRLEDNFNSIDTILIDVDNEIELPDGTNSVRDSNLMKKFEDEYHEYDYIIWESASSTPEWPRFRAIILLDERIEWITKPEKFTKKAIKYLFRDYADMNASWYYTPTRAKIGTVRRHLGKPYPSSQIIELVKSFELSSRIAELDRRVRQSKASDRGWGEMKGNWRNLPSVRKCLSGLIKGERDTSVNAACYAMKKLGYLSNVSEFLNECDIPSEMRMKFLHQYR